jgi:hypothetical protein
MQLANAGEDLDGAIQSKLGLDRDKPESAADHLIEAIATHKFHGKVSKVELEQTKKMLQGTPTEILKEMLKDMEHPSLFERAQEINIKSTVGGIERPAGKPQNLEISLSGAEATKNVGQVSSDRRAAARIDSNSAQRESSVRRLPGVKESSWAGVAAAVKAGTHGAARMPGVKEATWPFAPGSFSRRRVPHIPGVNENSWWVFEPGSSWRADRARAAAKTGGCRPGPGGRLVCEGDAGAQSELETAINRATGLADVKARATLLRDAKQQGLGGVAAVFGTSSMRPVASGAGVRRSGRVQMLADTPPAALRLARTQSLEIVGSQCSTLLDCFQMQGGRLVPHRTTPVVAAEWDREVASPTDSASPWEVASNAARRASEIASGWDRRRALIAPGYTGRISRPSAHSPTGEARDVAAAGWPTSRDATAMRTMYARRPSRAGQVGRALAAPARTSMLASNVPFFDDDLEVDGDGCFVRPHPGIMAR